MDVSLQRELMIAGDTYTRKSSQTSRAGMASESVGESEGSSADPPSSCPQVGPVPTTHTLSCRCLPSSRPCLSGEAACSLPPGPSCQERRPAPFLPALPVRRARRLPSSLPPGPSCQGRGGRLPASRPFLSPAPLLPALPVRGAPKAGPRAHLLVAPVVITVFLLLLLRCLFVRTVIRFGFSFQQKTEKTESEYPKW